MRFLDEINEKYREVSLSLGVSPTHIVLNPNGLEILIKDCKDFLASNGIDLDSIDVHDAENAIGMDIAVSSKNIEGSEFTFLKEVKTHNK